jgi:hypothetical protein
MLTIEEVGKQSLEQRLGRMSRTAARPLLAWHDDNHLDQLRRALDGKV